MLWIALAACTGAELEPAGPPLDWRALPLDQAFILVSHNAMANADDGFLLPNQRWSYERQLEAGVRGFMLDVHDDDGVTSLCHGTCALGAQPIVDGLGRFTAWLDAHPEELLVFVIQDEVPIERIVEGAIASGLAAHAVAPPAGPWPSAQTLVSEGGRALLLTEGRHASAPAWLPHAYAHAWDNDYAARTVEDFDCDPLRGTPDNPIFLLNHFLTAPVATEALAEQANTRASLDDHLDRCEETWERPVNWLALDFIDIGAGLEVLADRNAERLAELD